VERDLPVLLDGTVPLCREDLRREYALGNLLDQPIEDVWHHGESFYRRHITEDYPALCKGCDEYYTYNF
jgi:radical SAM protein with 4Fe4S-binding SPASM domain